jgi:hypothetical protein
MGSVDRRPLRAVTFALALLLMAVAPAAADQQTRANQLVDFGAAAPTLGQHGTLLGHLPPVQHNLEVVSEFETLEPFGDVVEGQIADLAVHKGFAYLNSWDEPSCTRGGTFVVDIRDPANPQDLGFIPATPGYYHGEGAHVVSLDTPEFTGDVLAVNDEACTNAENRPPEVSDSDGGFDLYNVTDPANPQPLVMNAGDQSEEGSTVQDPSATPKSYHSVFVWEDRTAGKAYLVASDNTELADVDIFDITDPANPVFINDFDLLAAFPQVEDESANGNSIFNHDMVVKQIGDRMVMIVSYWDGGYVQLDVTDPTNPIYITDTNFDDPDPLTHFDPPEGNAHQAEFSHDNEFILAADEDFSVERLTSFSITTGPDAGEYEGSSLGGAAPIQLLEDDLLNGPTVYGGYGCADSDPVPLRSDYAFALEPGEEAILVLQRGPAGDPDNPEEACFPGEKAQAAADAGWDAVVIGNRHIGTPEEDSASCGSGGFTSAVVAVCTTHEALHLIFGEVPSFEVPYPPGHGPPLGAEGEKVEATAVFDGWGYAHLYDAETSQELDAFAIPEALDSRFATGFGDLSIHEFATDPTENLAYSSYYTGGIRVFGFSRAGGLVQRGAWIDEGGSNFWGIEQFTTPDGERLIAGSDRDFGLVILRYTGPGAPEPPSCSNTSAETEANTPVSVPLTCTDANGNPLTRTIASQPQHGTLGDVVNGAVTYTPAADFTGADSFTFHASDGAATSNAATASLTVTEEGAPSNRFTLRVGKYRNGRLVLVLNVPGPGRVAAGLRANLPASIARSVRLARRSRSVSQAGRVRLVLKASRAKRRQVAKALARKGRLRGRVTVSFRPTGGTKRTTTRRITIR